MGGPPAAPADGTPRFAEVIVDEPVGVLSYSVPEGLQDELCVGVGVHVPLGRRRTRGYVLALLEADKAPERKCRAVLSIDEERPVVAPSLLQLVVFASRYYCAWPGEVLALALPHAARKKSNAFRLTEAGLAQARALSPADAGAPDAFCLQPAASLTAVRPQALNAHERALLWAGTQPHGFFARRMAQALALPLARVRPWLRRWVLQGWCQAQARAAQRRKQAVWLQRAPLAKPSFTARQTRAQTLWALLPADGGAVALATLRAQNAAACAAVGALVKKGMILREERDEPLVRGHRLGASPAQAPQALSAGQQAALSAIEQKMATGGFEAFVLFGVTGSGKTEVYLRAIDHALQRGRTALVLVPEIALTPQLGAQFRARFGDAVATFHSGLGPAERRDEWERVASGRARIALGARSALFLPLESLGLIVVDEEHETSFKQEESPHYHGRDLAIWRAKQAGCPVVLGSATPALESWHNAQTGRFHVLSMPTRARGQALPQVSLISMKTCPPAGDDLISEPLAEALQRTVARGEQAILFLNRRGFAPYIFCRDCGHPFRCTHCEVALTWHKRREQLLCHYCGHAERTPQRCPLCQGVRVGVYGAGIERLEAEVVRRFAAARHVRLDRDAARSPRQLHEALRAFRQGEAQILIGTQMVAKGHDFPNVTLVGAVAADASLNLPDFRAAERTFQLLTQVAGRAGRGERPGRVLVQAYETDHYAIACAQAQDYRRFAALELGFRQELGYPPFAHLALLRLEGEELEAVQNAAQRERELLERAIGTPPRLTLLGPVPAPLARLRGLFRLQILLKAPTRAALRDTLCAYGGGHGPRARIGGVRRTLDIDPSHML